MAGRGYEPLIALDLRSSRRLQEDAMKSFVLHSKLIKVNGAPHGLNVCHASAFNDALLSFLRD